jgi:hypothetical protein
MKYIEVVKALADHARVDLEDVAWLAHDQSGLENITEFELFWDGEKDGRPMRISKVFKKSEYPDLFRSFVADK